MLKANEPIQNPGAFPFQAFLEGANGCNRLWASLVVCKGLEEGMTAMLGRNQPPLNVANPQ